MVVSERRDLPVERGGDAVAGVGGEVVVVVVDVDVVVTGRLAVVLVAAASSSATRAARRSISGWSSSAQSVRAMASSTPSVNTVTIVSRPARPPTSCVGRVGGQVVKVVAGRVVAAGYQPVVAGGGGGHRVSVLAKPGVTLALRA